MIVAKYVPGQLYDDGLKWVVNNVKQRTLKANDDFFILCAGERGTGKTTISLHALNEFVDGPIDMKYVAWSQENFAAAQYHVAMKDKPRYLIYDEANVSKRNAMTKFNKDILDLYLAIRGQNIFHWWNNPSIEIIDKPFLKNVVNGVIVIRDKGIDRPRTYFYFTKASMLQIYEKYGNIELDTIWKVRRKYAYYRGWFVQKTGDEWEDYNCNKKDRMDTKAKDFYDKYANVNKTELSTQAVTALLGISADSVRNYYKKAIENKVMVEGVHFNVNLANRKYFTQAGLDVIKYMAMHRGKLPDDGRVTEP